jgi:hypothetical protein
MVEVVTGGFREEDDSDAQDQGPDPAYAHGDAVGAGVVAGFGSVVYAVCCEDTDSDEELVATGKVKVKGGIIQRVEELTRQQLLER